MKNLKFSGTTAFFIGNILFGITAPLTKLIFAQIPLGVYLLPKFLIPGLVVLVVARYFKQWQKLTKRQYLLVFGLAILNTTLSNLFFYIALENISAMYSMLASLLFPIGVYILAIAVLKEKLHPKALAGIIICFLGVALLYFGSHIEHGVAYFSLLGLLFLLASVVASAYSTVLSKPVLQKIPTMQFVSTQLIFGSLFFIPQFIMASSRIDWSSPPLTPLFVLLSLCLIISPLGYIGYFWGIKKIDVEDSAGQLYVTPIAGIIGSVILLGEKLTNLYAISVVIIMVGIWLGKANISRLWISLQRPTRFSFWEIIKGAIKRLSQPL